VREAMEAGVWVFCCGLMDQAHTSVVDPAGTITPGPPAGGGPFVSGLTIIDVPSREEALEWAAKIAAACRCPQSVREVLPDPEVYRAPTTRADRSSA